MSALPLFMLLLLVLLPSVICTKFIPSENEDCPVSECMQNSLNANGGYKKCDMCGCEQIADHQLRYAEDDAQSEVSCSSAPEEYFDCLVSYDGHTADCSITFGSKLILLVILANVFCCVICCICPAMAVAYWYFFVRNKGATIGS